MRSIHPEPHPLAGQTVEARRIWLDPVDFIVEDWWDRVVGGSWRAFPENAHVSPVIVAYVDRIFPRATGIPFDDEVICGKIDGLGHLVHATELPPVGA